MALKPRIFIYNGKKPRKKRIKKLVEVFAGQDDGEEFVSEL